VSQATALVGSGDEQSRRSRSALATSLAPPSLVERMISSPIQRRTVLSDIPVSWAMSAARRYSVPSVMTAAPEGGELVRNCRLLAVARSIHARLAPPAGARAQRQRNRLCGRRSAPCFLGIPAVNFRASYPRKDDIRVNVAMPQPAEPNDFLDQRLKASALVENC